MNIKLTFNETTYEFHYYEPKGIPTYAILINGVESKTYHLEQGTIESGSKRNPKVENIWVVYWNNFDSATYIKDFSLNEIVKVINYITKIENK